MTWTLSGGDLYSLSLDSLDCLALGSIGRSIGSRGVGGRDFGGFGRVVP